MKKGLFVLAAFFLGSCSSDCCSPERTVAEELLGSWVAFETGSSNGADYHITPVPSSPAQTVTFRQDGTVSTNVEIFGSAGYYDIEIRTDTVPHPTIGGVTVVRTDTILSFYESRYSGRGESDGMRLPGWEIRDGNLYLYFGCIEGCHMGLRRVE